MRTYKIEIHSLNEGEPLIDIIKTTEGEDFVCSEGNCAENIYCIKEFFKLRREVYSGEFNRTTQECSEIISRYEDRRWFCFEKIPCVMKENGKIDFAIKKEGREHWESQGAIIKEFYSYNFEKIKLPNAFGYWVECICKFDGHSIRDGRYAKCVCVQDEQFKTIW